MFALVLWVGVALASDPTVGDPPLAHMEETRRMAGFSWVIPNQLAGMPRPGGVGSLAGDLAFLRSQGLDLLVSLTETPVPPEELAKYGIRGLHIPVPDFSAPKMEQLAAFVAQADVEIKSGRQVGVHCAAGVGRTGTFLAAYLVSLGMPADTAIAEIRRQRPGSIEMPDQEQAVRDFAALRSPVSR